VSPGGARRRLAISKTAAKGIEELMPHVKEACKSILRGLAEGSERGKALKGELSDLRSVRLGRSHRLLYRETADEIQVVDVGPRGDIYRR
jgi:mRNA-degrading endonuclease RelE of RelBE toxin-antitoxin system